VFSAFDHQMMRRALELAALGRYTSHPNPRVGCVVVQGERIVGEGWHRKWGEPHAEPLALAAAGDAARGATVYVSLEPHSYHGRTPPCTEALIRAGVKKVVCGALDANPKVHGQGVTQMQAAGIEVLTGLMEKESRELNLGFEKRMRTGLPRMVVKIAASLDGRVALANGKSQWITSEAARADVQRLRAESSAVLTGIDTVIADDPRLTVRDPAIDLLGRQPLRVVLDSKLRTPATAQLLREPGETLILTSQALGDSDSAQALRDKGAIVRGLPLDAADASSRIDLGHVLCELGERQCNDVLVEAGPTLSGRVLALGLADELIVYLAPKLLGPDARPLLRLPLIESLDDGIQFDLHSTTRIGPDLKLVLRPQRRD
jgi:diaminohydroxyphosphoribosylaminopyrimidine deaminase/5-amino-6-(5-phosphoribosylamino)uracil reductase